MMEMLASGRLIDAILMMVVLEALLLLVLPRYFKRLPSLARLWPNLLAGACLLVAVRFALSDAPIVWVAAALLASLIAHLVDIARQTERPVTG